MSAQMLSDELEKDILNNLDVLRRDVKSMEEKIGKMLDPNTSGAENWKEEFIRDSEMLQDNLQIVRRIIERYSRMYGHERY
jgi:hypothetical protein